MFQLKKTLVAVGLLSALVLTGCDSQDDVGDVPRPLRPAQQQIDAAVIAHLLALRIQMHACRFVRGDVLLKLPLENERADISCSQPAIDRGKLPPALLREVDGDDMARHDEAMCRIKHHRDLPQKSPGACLRMTRDARLLPVHRLLGTGRLPAAVFRFTRVFLCCARPLSFPGSLWVATSRIG